MVLKITRAVVGTPQPIRIWTVHRRWQQKSNIREVAPRIITEERLIHLRRKVRAANKRRVTILKRETLPLPTAIPILFLTAVEAYRLQWSRVLAWPTLSFIRIPITWRQPRAFLPPLPQQLTNLMQVEGVTQAVVCQVRNNQPRREIPTLPQPRPVAAEVAAAQVTLHRETVGEGAKRRHLSLRRYRILNSACSLTYAEGIKPYRATKGVRHIIIMFTSLKIRWTFRNGKEVKVCLSVS